jgi:hypothetical protein
MLADAAMGASERDTATIFLDGDAKDDDDSDWLTTLHGVVLAM